MTPKECKFADWREVGLTDGLAGKPLAFFNERRSDCAEAEVKADTKAYLSGRDQGLKSYCQMSNAAQVGLRGEVYAGVCSAAIDQEFRRRYRIGFDIHSFQAEIAKLQNRFESLERHFHKNRQEFDKRLGSQDKNQNHQHLYREFEDEQHKIRQEQSDIERSLQWNQEQLRNAGLVLEKLR
jgi:hypothetical protein